MANSDEKMYITSWEPVKRTNWIMLHFYELLKLWATEFVHFHGKLWSPIIYIVPCVRKCEEQHQEMQRQTPATDVMVFHPTIEEFKQFSRYIQHTEKLVPRLPARKQSCWHNLPENANSQDLWNWSALVTLTRVFKAYILQFFTVSCSMLKNNSYMILCYTATE